MNMAGAVDSILDLVGNTPLVRLNKLPQSLGIKATVFAKLEYYNPGNCRLEQVPMAACMRLILRSNTRWERQRPHCLPDGYRG